MPLSLLVGSAARPFGHSGPLRTGGAVSLMCGSVRRLGARPGPAALQSCFVNFACNSLLGISKFEFMSLELQRFWALLKVHSIELHAKFGEGRVGGCGGVLVRDFFLPACRVGGGSGTKFSLHAKSGPKSAFWGLLGEFCTGWACQGRLRGEFCTGSGTACGIKFSLLGLLVAEAVQSSPCMRKVGRNRRFGACWESFVPGGPPSRACWESFVPGGPPSQACWESFVPGMVQRGRAG